MVVESALSMYRQLRVFARQIRGIEPLILVEENTRLEYFGTDSCGWAIPAGKIDRESVIVDVGLGEDISFSTALMDRFGCKAYGFDPTPKSIAYVENIAPSGFVLHRVAIANRAGEAAFHLPKNVSHVSGTLTKATHTGVASIKVEQITITDVFERTGIRRIDILKMDIEGAEYDVLLGEEFERQAARIGILCIEFHHRWPGYSASMTTRAVEKLRKLGFSCCWRARSTNQEFTFINRRREW